MDFFRKLFSCQKDFNPSIFSFFALKDVPKMGEKEFLKAYRGWVFAFTNAVAKRVANIELKLQQRNGSDRKDVPEHPTLDLLRKVNDFSSFYDLTYASVQQMPLD